MFTKSTFCQVIFWISPQMYTCEFIVYGPFLLYQNCIKNSADNIRKWLSKTTVTKGAVFHHINLRKCTWQYEYAKKTIVKTIQNSITLKTSINKIKRAFSRYLIGRRCRFTLQSKQLYHIYRSHNEVDFELNPFQTHTKIIGLDHILWFFYLLMTRTR